MDTLSTIITICIALAAIISPIITTHMNNTYQLKLKKLELLNDEAIAGNTHNQTILENYIKYSGRCIASKGSDSYVEYMESFYLVLAYVTLLPRLDIISIDNLIQTSQWDKAHKKFLVFISEIAGKI